jgi:hypothetical protein
MAHAATHAHISDPPPSTAPRTSSCTKAFSGGLMVRSIDSGRMHLHAFPLGTATPSCPHLCLLTLIHLPPITCCVHTSTRRHTHTQAHDKPPSCHFCLLCPSNCNTHAHTQSGAPHTPGVRGVTPVSSRIQRVAIHFSPASTGSAEWMLLESSSPFGRFDLRVH